MYLKPPAASFEQKRTLTSDRPRQRLRHHPNLLRVVVREVSGFGRLNIKVSDFKWIESSSAVCVASENVYPRAAPYCNEWHVRDSDSFANVFDASN